jgi:hypothetical protein
VRQQRRQHTKQHQPRPGGPQVELQPAQQQRQPGQAQQARHAQQPDNAQQAHEAHPLAATKEGSSGTPEGHGRLLRV